MEKRSVNCRQKEEKRWCSKESSEPHLEIISRKKSISAGYTVITFLSKIYALDEYENIHVYLG